MLQLWQEELEHRADEISTILKTFGHKNRAVANSNMPLQPRLMTSQNSQVDHSQTQMIDEENLHVDSLCDLPVQMNQNSAANKMHLDLFKPSPQSLTIDSLSTQAMQQSRPEEMTDEELRQQDAGSIQKYESPKFFVGSGSPVGGSKRKLSSGQEE